MVERLRQKEGERHRSGETESERDRDREVVHLTDSCQCLTRTREVVGIRTREVVYLTHRARNVILRTPRSELPRL